MTPLLVEQLKTLGLNANEARVYLALLEKGKGTVTDIAHAAKLNRTTGYDILERLALYGLANRAIAEGGKNKRVYTAEPPSRLNQFLLNKKHAIEQRLNKLPDLLPDLQSLYKTTLKPTIKFFEGRDGIKNIYWHTLQAKSAIYSILDLSDYLPEFDQFGKEYVRERARLGIYEKVLVVRNNAAEEFYTTTYVGKKRHQKYTEYRWLEHEVPFSPAAEVNIYDDMVMGVLVKPGENMAFEIESASFANSLKIIFEIAWERSKQVQI